MRYIRFAALLAFACSLPLDSQIGGQYPGGGYPGGRGGMGIPGIPGIPRPGRKSKKTETPKDSATPAAIFTGTLRKVDSKNIVVESADARILEFERSRKTEFYKGAEQVEAAVFKSGDHVSVEATRDEQGYLHAVKVRLADAPAAAPAAAAKPSSQEEEQPPVLRRRSPEAPAAATTPSSQEDEQAPVLRRRSPEAPAAAATPSSQEGEQAPVLRRRSPEAPAAAPPAPAAPAASAPAANAPAANRPAASAPAANRPAANHPAETRPAVAAEPAEPEEPAPVLRRRAKASSPLPPPPPAPAAAPAVAPEPEPERRQVAENRPAPGAEVVERIDDGPPLDPIIEKAREAAESTSETLPNYVCQEQMARFVTDTPRSSWRALDIVSSEVVYEDGHESYRNIAINGKPVKKKMEEIGGSWSTGEFGTELRDLLSPATAARFRRRGEETIDNHLAVVYDFEVDRENSHWHIAVPSQSIMPAYNGSIFIEKSTGRVLRIESEARKLPKDFPLDKVESNVDYQYVRFGEGQFLLPVHAENLSCQRGSPICSRNTIDFRNCHKYTSDTQVTFEPAK